MRKILLATPIKGGISSRYMTGFVETFHQRRSDVELDICIHDGTAVNFARNEIVHYALKIGAREIVFIDEDMSWDAKRFERLISHVDIDIVAGLYCKRQPGKAFWLLNLLKGAEIDQATGLCEVEDIATGFMKIRVDTVIKTMMDKMPEREYYNMPQAGKPVTAWELFPMGVVGPRTAEERLKKVKALLADGEWQGDVVDLLNAINNACHEKQEPGNLRGEDYYFCHNARQLGFKVHADFGLPPIGHIGKATYPITPDMVGLDPGKFMAELKQDAIIERIGFETK